MIIAVTFPGLFSTLPQVPLRLYSMDVISPTISFWLSFVLKLVVHDEPTAQYSTCNLDQSLVHAINEIWVTIYNTLCMVAI